MKQYILLTILGLFLFNCSKPDDVTPVTSTHVLDGKWKLIKITYGYPPPNQPTFTTNVSNEIYQFSPSSMTFSVTKDGKITENGSYKVETKVKNTVEEKSVIFLTDSTYSTYTMLSNNQELVLYQRTHIGAVLADGNSFHYAKVQ